MGLDITAYSHLTAIGKHTNGWCEDEDHIEAFSYDEFPQSFRGIPILSAYRPTLADGSKILDGGCYVVTDATKSHQFQAGSYGGYNVWRENLRNQFNPYVEEDVPFFELIWFADNEGTIGPEAAVDLLADFREHAAAYVQPDNWRTTLYSDWTRAFELAADGGLVQFH